MKSAVLAILTVIAVALVGAAILPYIETNRWFVRMADFPRLQFLLLSAATIVALACFVRRSPRLAGGLIVGLLLAGASHVYTLWPYRPGGEEFVDRCDPEDGLSVMVANVWMHNRQADGLIAMVRREQPDLLLAMETDPWWDEALEPLATMMPYHIDDVRRGAFGLHLFSRLPLNDAKIRHFAGQSAPAVTTQVVLRNGESINFIGLHPRPPHPGERATGRDAQLYTAAALMREADRTTVVAGDLNSTPWETTVERMRRIAGLIDPRRGYGYVATFSAKSWWQYWPLDHVFHQPGFATVSIERLGYFGSDHYPLLVRLCRVAPSRSETPPNASREDFEQAARAIAAAGAE